MNPMVRKELRHRMRERKAWLLPVVYLLVLGAAVTVAYFFSSDELKVGGNVQGVQIGVAVFLTVAFAQLTVLMLLAPIFSAGAITIEKEQRTMAGLLTSLLRRRDIWWGKFASALLFLVLLLVAATPVLGLSFAMGGIGVREVAMVTLTTLIILGTFSAVGLGCSAYFRRSVTATAVTYVSIIALTVISFVVFMLMAATDRWHQSGPELPLALRIPLYFNPYYLLISSLAAPSRLAPDWVVSVSIYVAIGLAACGLGILGLRRGAEQG